MPANHSARETRSPGLAPGFSRRDALRGLAGLGLAPLARPFPAPASPAPGNLDKFDHIVVLMLENRSFDNVLGYLYPPGTVPRGQAFAGVAGKNLSNPIPAGADQAQRGTVPVAPGTTPDNPNPDPGEEYPHINTQLYGTFLPPANRGKDALQMAPPYNAPSSLPATPPMNGFVADYIATFTQSEGRPPTYDEYRVIMDCFPPSFLPAVSGLARAFAVCDHWHCAVPSQTFCNRAFFHAATSSGAVVNAPYGFWVRQNTAPTIFNRISAANDPRLSWKIYYDDQDVVPLTALIHYPVLKDAVATNCFPMAQFLEDARTGQLPSYAFIEPRLFVNHNDMHPPVKIAGKTQPSSVLAGDLLVNQIYDAIRLADSPTGSNWRNTLLVITFDEHGGCFDHVPPPAAVPPDPAAPAGQMGFRFDRKGVRVPAILISAYIEPGTVLNTALDHGSILKTIETKWGLAPLTGRDRAATGVGAALTRSTPRQPADWPVITPPPQPATPAAANEGLPMNELQTAVAGLVVALAGDQGSILDRMSLLEAVQYMQQVLAKRP